MFGIWAPGRRVGRITRRRLCILRFMDPITSRNRNRSASADAYWRRRLFALAAGLAVIGVLAWAVGGTAGAHPTAATTPLHHHHVRPPAPPAASATPAPSASASPSPSPTPRPSPHATSGKHASQAAKPKPGHTPAATAAGGTQSPGSGCQPADVVLTLTASSNSYGRAARPQFDLDVVSTASRTCTFNVGTRHLTVLVESGGVRVWNSADCAGKSGASSAAKLKRGVPLQLQVSWDRLLSSPGCRMPRTAARPGTYTVTASAGHLRSHTLVFVLR